MTNTEGVGLGGLNCKRLGSFEPLPINSMSSPLQIRDGLWRACEVFNDDAFTWKSLRCWVCCGSGYGHLWKGDFDLENHLLSEVLIWTMLMTMHVNFSFAHALDIYEKLMPLVTVMVVGQSTADSDSKISFFQVGAASLLATVKEEEEGEA